MKKLSSKGSDLLGNQQPEDLIGENGLLKQLTKLLVEKALDAELTPDGQSKFPHLWPPQIPQARPVGL